MNTSFTFIDLFAGIGGFHEALRSVGGKCLAACEIDMQARETYLANHQVPEEMFFKDINNINPNNIPNHDILCAGFPCQPFSISGKQKALNDERSRVIHSLFNIIKEKKPKVVILENVKHLRYISKGEVFAFLTKTLEEIGYNVTAKLINAKDFGIPQNRERWIIIGMLDKAFTFKTSTFRRTTIKDILEENGEFQYLLEPYTTIKNPKLQESGLLFCGYRNKTIRKAGVRDGTNHLSRVHKQPNRIYSINGIHPTIPSQESSGRFWIMLDDGKVRKLTILECFRLMGFQDSFKKPVALGQLYKQIGNSVCVPMIKQFAQWILEDLQIENRI